MTARRVIFGIAISMLFTGTSWAQNSNINTQSTMQGNSQNFGNNSFRFSNGNVTISQNSSNNSFCQFFSFSSGLNSIIQIIQGNSMTQVLGTPGAVTDPCN